MRVLAALSGGVDSAVAAARALDAGHEVVGVHMALSSQPQECRIGARGCCSVEDAGDAARAAHIMGIPFYVWDLAEDFERTVVEDFVEQYSRGRTPNPCVRCNEFVKFRELSERARALGFDAVCTGHYASIVEGPSGLELHRGADLVKDQSYVLAVMGREELSRVVLPLGNVTSKAQVRAEAEVRGLGVSDKPDSYDICFIPDGDTRGFLRARLGSVPGQILSPEGEVLGEHEGYWNFTVGQRKGLRLDRPASDGRPRYVLETRPARNEVVVGASELLNVDEIACSDVVWLAPDDLGSVAGDEGGAGAVAGETVEVFVQVRAHGDAVPVLSVTHSDVDAAREGGEPALTVRLARPIRGVAAGQSAVLYRGSRVIGEATIERASRVRSEVFGSV